MNHKKTKILITAEQAYPAYERAFLEAKNNILMGFRIFDPNTRLYSKEARAIGSSWADLFVHTLNRGVDITLKISDFDPIAAADLHIMTTRSVRDFNAIKPKLKDTAGQFIVGAHMHPAKIGPLSALALWPAARKKLAKTCQKINEGEWAYEDVPGVHSYIQKTKDGFAPKRWARATLHPATHHHKCFVVDDEIAFLGGIDVNERRYDDIDHRRTADETWHDVQVMIKDKAISAALRQHLENFEKDIKADTASAEVGLLRTLSAPHRFARTLSPKKALSQIKTAHLKNIAASERLMYLETQFFRDKEICDALVKRSKEVPNLKLVLVLPAAPDDIAFEDKDGIEQKFGEYLQAQCVQRVKAAYGDNLIIASPVSPRPAQEDDRSTLSDSPIVYVHSKVSVFDDKAAIVSSANLNTRSLEWDTEVGCEFKGQDVNNIKEKVWEAWWSDDLKSELQAPSEVVFDTWKEQVWKNGDVPPQERKGFLVPYDVRPAKKMGMFLPFVPRGMV